MRIGLCFMVFLSGCGMLNSEDCLMYSKYDGWQEGQRAYVDADRDGHGAPASLVNPSICIPYGASVAGYSTNNDDCDDARAAVNPDAEELCNDGLDNDCDNGADCWDNVSCGGRDIDGDGYYSGENEGDDCNDCNPDSHPDMIEACWTDDNCDGYVRQCDTGESSVIDTGE
jgi:hypothetical protein